MAGFSVPLCGYTYSYYPPPPPTPYFLTPKHSVILIFTVSTHYFFSISCFGKWKGVTPCILGFVLVDGRVKSAILSAFVWLLETVNNAGRWLALWNDGWGCVCKICAEMAMLQWLNILPLVGVLWISETTQKKILWPDYFTLIWHSLRIRHMTPECKLKRKIKFQFRSKDVIFKHAHTFDFSISILLFTLFGLCFPWICHLSLGCCSFISQAPSDPWPLIHGRSSEQSLNYS